MIFSISVANENSTRAQGREGDEFEDSGSAERDKEIEGWK